LEVRPVQTILVVDDEEVVRTVVRDMLESDGYSILDTGDPRDALRIASEQPIHLLLSDVVMPVMKGPELATKVLAASPSTKVLLMSAYPMSEVAVPENAFLSKPFSIQVLNDKVRQVLEESSPFGRPARPA
jgi:two-component system cell cycle sensor histidine kinase/response regulator CckA